YLDDNPSATSMDTYTIGVEVTDDDTGQGVASRTVLVKNVAPLVVLDPVTMINEDGTATLTGTITDPGSLDPHRLTIEWDDPNNLLDSVFDVPPILEINPSTGVLSPLLMVGDVLMSLTPGDPTVLVITSIDANTGTVGFRSTHQYLDDGVAGAAHPGANGTLSDTSTIRVTVEDDDAGTGSRTATVEVLNVDPVINILSVLPSSIKETESVTLSGTFSDVGSLDFHSIEIHWGDGLVDGAGGSLNFMQTASGSGSFLATHTYDDNDTVNPDDSAKDNIYSIVVTITDDDGGSVTEIFSLTVLNVDPVLEPIAPTDATDVDTNGETTETITFSEVGADELFVWVDWGDIRDPGNPFLPGAAPFVLETPTPFQGAGAFTITLTHTYAGPPNPLSPSADIDIRVVVVDDDFNIAAAGGQVDGPLVGQPIMEPGRSAFRMVAISNTGTGTTPVRIDTTPEVPRLVFPVRAESALQFEIVTSTEGLIESVDLRSSAGDAKAANERFLELRVIGATGDVSEGIRLKPQVLNNLPGFFVQLTDNQYAIFLVRTETNSRRLVIEFFIRNGRAIDPGDDSEGTRDRPPTDEVIEQPVDEQPPEIPEAKTERPKDGEVSADSAPLPAGDAAASFEGIPAGYEAAAIPDFRVQRQSWTPAMAALVAGASYRSWAQEVDRTVAAAGPQKWRRLRLHRQNKRKNR
ncbi:MAG: PKD domain-containing protein, partial [Pirellulales bacterium]|nr:PKD domain-containing protein [Pirellulales bacterium]